MTAEADAVEALARALGVWRPMVEHGGSCIWPLGDDARERTGKTYRVCFAEGAYDLTDAEAPLWLALYARVERETCPHPWARAFLGAMPLTAEQRTARFVEALDSNDEALTGTEHDRARPGHIDALTVYADRLQSTDTLAEALAEPAQDARDRATLGLGLALWLGRVLCQTCGGDPPEAGARIRWWKTRDSSPRTPVAW